MAPQPTPKLGAVLPPTGLHIAGPAATGLFLVGAAAWLMTRYLRKQAQQGGKDKHRLVSMTIWPKVRALGPTLEILSSVTFFECSAVTGHRGARTAQRPQDHFVLNPIIFYCASLRITVQHSCSADYVSPLNKYYVFVLIRA